MEQIISHQRQYFESGATMSLAARRQALTDLRSGIVKYQERLQEALREDVGKSPTESYMTEIGQVLGEIDYTLKHLKRWMRPQRRPTALANFPAHTKIISSPYGVVLVMSPWNYPVNLSLSPLVGALAAGNCCVIKPSELSPATAITIGQLIEDSLPKALVTVVNGGIDLAQRLLEQHFDHILYTGSIQVGKIVMECAAKHLTPVTLELGGKSPAIVTKSAPMRLTARRIAFGKYLNVGQTCVAPDYILVEECVHDTLLTLLKEEITKMYGDNALEEPHYGKIVNRRHFDRIMRLITPSKVAFGGQADPETLRIAPTILDGVSSSDPVMQEKIFGPLLPIISVKDIDEAYTFVQQRPHPLALYLFTADRKTEEYIMQGLQYGGGCVNDVISHIVARNLPFGGVGDSGMGAYHGRYSFLTFSHLKSIVKQSKWIDIPLRYQPYAPCKVKWIKRFM